MPTIFSPTDFGEAKNELQKDYFDRHTPVIHCDTQVGVGELFKIKIRIGNEYTHPHEADHHISYIQLWNRETLLTETRFYPGILPSQPGNIEVEYTMIMPQVSMNLTALSYCTKHGLWRSQPVVVKAVSH
ncbi:MAG: desulfoferrodoxin family protein [Bacteroidales bacterium]|nr:desulfoferrodoxin family protein [Bacteroidales bacterium]